MAVGEKYHLGLTLGGGGAKGIAHLGVLKAMQEHGLKPDVISGTSAGAMAAAFYADGSDVEDVLGFFNNKKFSEFAGFSMPQGGFIKMDRFGAFLEKHLKARTFEELSIPIVVTATDLERGKLVEFSSGDLIPAIMASCAVPIVFQPVAIDGVYYVDGGVFKNFPVSTIRKKCKHLIGVNVAPIVKEEFKNSMTYVAERSFYYMSLANTLNDRKLCDILVEAKDVSKYTMFQLEELDQIFSIGYESAIDAFKEKVDVLRLIADK